MLTQNRSYISYAKLNEQCRRALNVIERHQRKTPAIGSHKPMLQSTVERYFDQQEQLSALKVSGKQALREGRQAVRELNSCIRSWFGQLNFAVVGFDAGDYDCRIDSPDSVIGAGERLIEFVLSHKSANGDATAGEGDADADAASAGTAAGAGDNGTMWFADQMVEELTAVKDAAVAAWMRAQDCLADEQELRSAIRESAIEIQRALVSVRRTLRNTLGTSHRDYQKLRLSRSYHEDADELDVVEQIEGLASDDAAVQTGIGEEDTIRSEPFVVTTPPAAPPATEDKGNGKGKPADVAAYLQQSENQPSLPPGV
jgi:hypothetical protein